MLEMRQSRDRLIFNMGIPILVRRHLYIETAPSCFLNSLLNMWPLMCSSWEVTWNMVHMQPTPWVHDFGLGVSLPMCLVQNAMFFSITVQYNKIMHTCIRKTNDLMSQVIKRYPLTLLKWARGCLLLVFTENYCDISRVCGCTTWPRSWNNGVHAVCFVQKWSLAISWWRRSNGRQKLIPFTVSNI